MALPPLFLQLVTRAMAARREAVGAEARLSVLALGYPDLLVPRQVLEQIIAPELVAKLATRDDAEAILKWHQLEDVWQGPFYDSLSLFELLNADLVVTDIAVHRGMERIVDLNEPLPDDLRDRFDIVIDPGTCEHCFNVGQAFRNVCDAVRVGGYLAHSAPLNRFNHGFWNFSPTVYPDYLGDNGFTILTLMGIRGTLRTGYKTSGLVLKSKFEAPADMGIHVVARRDEQKPHVWPVQRKYREMLGEKASG